MAEQKIVINRQEDSFFFSSRTTFPFYFINYVQNIVNNTDLQIFF